MAIFDKAKEKFQGFMQGGEQANRNRRSNGGTSGYRPVRNQNLSLIHISEPTRH